MKVNSNTTIICAHWYNIGIYDVRRSKEVINHLVDTNVSFLRSNDEWEGILLPFHNIVMMLVGNRTRCDIWNRWTCCNELNYHAVAIIHCYNTPFLCLYCNKLYMNDYSIQLSENTMTAIKVIWISNMKNNYQGAKITRITLVCGKLETWMRHDYDCLEFLLHIVYLRLTLKWT